MEENGLWCGQDRGRGTAGEQSNASYTRQHPQPRRVKRNKAQIVRKKAGPTPQQALEGQNDAIQYAYSMQEINSSPRDATSSMVSTAASDSEGSLALFPAITPQLTQNF
ncbi:hypothetical protein NDU88_003372 [Pleurodeles waltl]|uniref:Uncharacterized protein n=1 Tax=Pleurodeles waltl TaxID=8319 RepID=A0AAV7KWU0_PLEWA|nr:hypothetical protein NDU88_003372 [Pleurodeles waltl]